MHALENEQRAGQCKRGQRPVLDQKTQSSTEHHDRTQFDTELQTKEEKHGIDYLTSNLKIIATKKKTTG
jgi:hypothetical protein